MPAPARLGLRNLTGRPLAKMLEQLSHRRAVERLLVERCLVAELDAEGVELGDAVELNRWGESVVGEKIEQEAKRVRSRAFDAVVGRARP